VINRPDRVQIWARQLAANDFPPICAMTGRPAEAWRRFRFATPPTWAYAILVLACLGGIGLIGFAIIMAAIAQRASGYLPLTLASQRTVNLAFWVPLWLLGLAFGIWMAAAIIGLPTNDATLNTIGVVLFWIGMLAFVVGLIGRLVVTPLVGPRAKVRDQQPGYYDKIVELRNVNPAFVAAVNQAHQARAAGYAPIPRAPSPPLFPSTN
jgi:Na+-transporting methylmalonyl-CoA/oxaloacetate decarboxylase gamma subunit